ncbi:MAG TPA: DUF6527 family protein [Chitinophagaceae bacterium]|nr:DUF6527 family protein [Chitinophagaceae bacterium]
MASVEITPVFVDEIGELEPNKIYISEKYHVAVHLCLCGCGQKTVTPLGKDGWSVIKHADATVSFQPSILNRKSKGICGAHYVITNNKTNVIIENES